GSGGAFARLIDRADDCARDCELNHGTDDPAANDFRRQGLDRERNEVWPCIHQAHQNAQRRIGACAATWNEAHTEHGEKERHHEVAEDQPSEVALKISFWSQKRWHFVMRTLHQRPVPNKAKNEEKNERCDERDEKFWRVHNVEGFVEFRQAPTVLSQKRVRAV